MPGKACTSRWAGPMRTTPTPETRHVREHHPPERPALALRFDGSTQTLPDGPFRHPDPPCVARASRIPGAVQLKNISCPETHPPGNGDPVNIEGEANDGVKTPNRPRTDVPTGYP